MYRRSTFAIARGGWLGGLALLVLTLAGASTARADTQMFVTYDYQFTDGTILPELRIAYETHGQLLPARDNAIVLLHETLGDHHAFDALIGPGKTFDTNKYFVVIADAIGGGESSSPVDGRGQDFPRYTVRDMMEAEYAMVTHGLGLTRLQALVGRSMGAFVALDLAAQHPDIAKSLVLLGPAPKSDANFQIVIDLMTSAVALDPEWDGGHYVHNPVEGLRHAGMIYYPWTVTAEYLDQLAPRQIAQESDGLAKGFADWDANALVLRFAACRTYDVTASSGEDMGSALARVTMPVLLMPAAGDRLLGLAGARRLRTDLPRATYVEIPTRLGHQAIMAAPGTSEGDFIDHAIRAFLAEPR